MMPALISLLVAIAILGSLVVMLCWAIMLPNLREEDAASGFAVCLLVLIGAPWGLGLAIGIGSQIVIQWWWQ